MNYLGEELYSNSGLLGLVELIPDVAGGDVGLAGASGADDDNLKHLVVVLHDGIINLI